MPKQSPTYDLMLLLSTSAEEKQRAKILADVEAAVADGGGSIEHKDGWGVRALSYQINHQPDAEYHLLQFTGPTPLLEALSHSLRITDGVLRFRIIKGRPGTTRRPPGQPERTGATDSTGTANGTGEEPAQDATATGTGADSGA